MCVKGRVAIHSSPTEKDRRQRQCQVEEDTGECCSAPPRRGVQRGLRTLRIEGQEAVNLRVTMTTTTTTAAVVPVSDSVGQTAAASISAVASVLITE